MSFKNNINISPKQSNKEKIENKNVSYDMRDEFENINSFRQSNIMCDITLVATDGVKIPAHKVILSSSSSFFLSKFNNVEFKEENKQSIQITEFDSKILETVINYIYTLKLDITENTIVDILKASLFFQLNRLEEKCCHFIENNLNLTNCIDNMNFYKLISHDRLYNLSFSYVLKNFFNLENSILYELSYDEIKTFISDNNLITESEEQVFKFVLNWTKFDEKNRTKYLPELMKHIRLSFVPNTFLMNVLKDPLLRDYTIMEYIIKHLNDPDSKHDRRNPKLINNECLSSKSDILIAIQNYGPPKYFEVYYNDMSSDSLKLQWKSGPKFFISPIEYSKIVAFDNKFLFSIGGYYYYKATDKVLILDLSTSSKKWMKTTPMISSRSDHAVCTHNNRIFAVGGVDENGQALNTIEVFDINTKLWSLYCTMSNSRRYCSAIFHNNFLYIVGGMNEDGQILSMIECFDDLSSTWNNYIDPLPQSLYSTCITISENNLYVVGGGDSEKKYLNTIFKFTLSRGCVWCTLPSSLLQSRILASCAVLDEKLYIFGGTGTTIDSLDLENDLSTTEDISMNFTSQNMLMFNKQYLTSLNVKL